MSDDLLSSLEKNDEERGLDAIAYRQIATMAIGALAPWGNPERINEDFVPTIREARRANFSTTALRGADPEAVYARRFDDCVRAATQAALERAGYDDATISSVIEALLDDPSV